jgi:hypothetical protein
MDLPRDPTTVPQARRYNRTFEAPRGRSFLPEETVVIEIPPIKNTYLTKNNKLHFDMTLSYNEASQATWNTIRDNIVGTGGYLATKYPYLNGFFGRTNAGTLRYDPINYYTKPVPFLDINGPYGFINRIRVYDWKGSTLLEDIREHDVLTAMLADFDFKDDNFHVFRPSSADTEDAIARVRKQPCSFLTPDQEILIENPISLSAYDNTTGVVTPTPVIVTQHYSLDLYSFLGKLSGKFVPLHNGFRIEFTFNKANIPISFSTANGSLTVNYAGYNTATPGVPNSFSTELDPSINYLNFTKIYLKADLLEVTPELDAKVEKVIHFQGFQYQLDFYPYQEFANGGGISDENRPDFTSRITPAMMSLNKVMIGQRIVPTFTANNVSSQQKLGFRIRNYVDTSDLLFNKSVINSFSNVSEFADAWLEAFGIYPELGITPNDFSVDEPIRTGTNGNQFLVYGQSQRNSTSLYLTQNINNAGDTIGSQWWPGLVATRSGDITAPNFGLYSTTEDQGRFLIVFDTRLPGTTAETISGISTSKNVLEYKLTASKDVCYKAYIDVFSQHDAVLRVDPSVSTTVSF